MMRHAGRRKVVRPVLIAGGLLAGGALLARRLGYRLGMNTVVRCRQGHLFTTIWIPGVKLREIDILVSRVQRCPVGRHWSLVVPVRDTDLAEQEREAARARHDARIP
jgi:hypothetical protein